MADGEFDPERIFGALCTADVRFVLIGGLAVPSLADVIRSKTAADREKDRRALPRLRELLEVTHDA